MQLIAELHLVRHLNLFLFTASIFTMLMERASAVMCVRCDSRTTAGCQDPFYSNERMQEIECSKGWCVKMKSRDLRDGEIFIVRNCSPTPHNSERCKESIVDSEFGRIPFISCVCSGRLCNASTSVHPPSTSTTILLLVTPLLAALMQT